MHMTDILSPAPQSEWLVPTDGSFHLPSAPTVMGHEGDSQKNWKKALKKRSRQLYELQQTLYADRRFSLLLVFQAMDAAGKDSTIRHVFSGVNPAGFQVSSFKQPSANELAHDFLWRTSNALPERGRIGIFNRSYYEETLVVKVHPEYLQGQQLPAKPEPDSEAFWQARYESIIEHERHLARNGTVVLKFWLNVSREEQHRRFAERLERSEKNWKFSAGDLKESARWDDYMAAYGDTLKATSKPWAPWYAIPADNKPYARYVVADTVVRTMRSLGLSYPQLDAEQESLLGEYRKQLIV